jgi:hypothetical protein
MIAVVSPSRQHDATGGRNPAGLWADRAKAPPGFAAVHGLKTDHTHPGGTGESSIQGVARGGRRPRLEER